MSQLWLSCFVMNNILKLLHPFMPFITEEIWQSLPHDGESLMISEWPSFSDNLNYADEETEMERIMTAVRAIRNRRAEMNVPHSKRAKLYIETPFTKTFESASVIMQKLAGASEVEVGDKFDIDGAVCIVTTDSKIYIPMGDLVDFKAERQGLTKSLIIRKNSLMS
jgi:valyl-tRNA synthetase